MMAMLPREKVKVADVQLVTLHSTQSTGYITIVKTLVIKRRKATEIHVCENNYNYLNQKMSLN